MDKGPFRVQAKDGGRQPLRPEGQPQQEETIEQRTSSRSSYPRQQRVEQAPAKSGKRFIMPVIIIVLSIALLGVIGWTTLGSSSKEAAAVIDSSKYQAVFFTNGQVYFGKLQAINSETMKLTDVFYLQTESQSAENQENPQSTSSDQTSSNVQLIKLGDEIHGPEDAMVNNKSQVLFYENIKKDSKVAQSINEYKSR